MAAITGMIVKANAGQHQYRQAKPRVSSSYILYLSLECQAIALSKWQRKPNALLRWPSKILITALQRAISAENEAFSQITNFLLSRIHCRNVVAYCTLILASRLSADTLTRMIIKTIARVLRYPNARISSTAIPSLTLDPRLAS
ncbi:hypothetical protein DM01DRAFT_1043509 [Hesseltinella vesiculosa]|uniref:Uncharacterized protein n=1 Tax=Hesseltinella vesiculosa TaxID=101127 RepID=A0A1X2GHU3_9FUNG|nr:hypothetical protein DM01DRAFT_1043509 [Hesseltinella vesiculosa]